MTFFNRDGLTVVSLGNLFFVCVSRLPGVRTHIDGNLFGKPFHFISLH